MKFPTAIAAYALLVVILGPLFVLLTVWPRYVPLSFEVYIGLLVASLLVAVPATVFFVRAVLSNIGRMGRSVSTEYIEREQRYTALAALFISLTTIAQLAITFTPAAPVYAALFLAYALVVLPASARHLAYRAAIVVRCTPAAAFDLITDPHNVSRYWPNAELAAPVDLPLHVGSTVRYRVREGRLVLEGDETVIELEPNQRFASQGTRSGNDLYTFTPVPGGTEIAYSFVTVQSMSTAVMGGAIRRRQTLKLMLERREQALRRIKDILEAPTPVSV